MRAVVTAASGEKLTGKVRMIAPTVDPQTRSALVYVDLPASTGTNAPFKAGMYASGAFELGTSGALTVPQQAIAVRDGFSYVFRLNRDQRVSQIKVQAGRRLADSIEIVSGITADTTIVVSGAGFLAVDGPTGEAYTRAGNLEVDGEGLLTLNGRPVLGDGGEMVLPAYRDLSFGKDGSLSITPPGGGARLDFGCQLTSD